MHNLSIKLEEYWNEIRYKRKKEDPKCTVPIEDAMWVWKFSAGGNHIGDFLNTCLIEVYLDLRPDGNLLSSYFLF